MIEIVRDKINVDSVLQMTRDPQAGGHVHFVGTIRNDGGISGIEYEAYETMALREMEKIVEKARVRWPIVKAAVVHRIGWVPVGEEAVVIAVSCAHRREAFEACEFIIDTIKHEVPIWKMSQEVGVDSCCGHQHAQTEKDSVTGVILAGGRSSRFGTNKALAPWKHHTMIEEVLESMQSVFSRVVIVTNTPEVYQHLSAKVLPVEILKDAVPHQGPLGGIEAAMRECGSIFVVACDMPLIRRDDIHNLLSKRTQKSLAVIGSRQKEEQKEYLFGYYSQELLPLVQSQLQARELSMGDFFKKIPSERIRSIDLPKNSCLNVNDVKTWQEVCDAVG